MELLAYLKIVWKRKWVVVSTVVLATAAAVLLTKLLPSSYTASVRLRILTTPEGEIGSLLQYDLFYADRLMNTYVELMTSRAVRVELAERLGYTDPPQIVAEIVPNTELLEVSVSDPDPAQAQRAANLLGEILVAKSRELYAGHGMTAAQTLEEQLTQFRGELDLAREDYLQLVNDEPANTEAIAGAQRAVQTREEIYYSLLERYEQARTVEAIQSNTVSIAEPAVLPENPSSPKLFLNLALGFLLGLVSGLGLAFVFENLDTRLDSPQKIESVTGLPILAELPSARWRQKTQHLFTIYPYAEIFQRLRTNLFGRHPEAPVQSLLVTSADLDEGKSTIALNLASAIALTGRRVLLIDADLRCPSLHQRLKLPNDAGLSDVLTGARELEEVVQVTQPLNLHVLTSGALEGPPAQVLDSERFAALLETLKSRYDVTLIDSPAFMAVAEASMLASLVDGVLLVFRRNWVPRAMARRMLKELSIGGARTLGVALNRTPYRRYRRYRAYFKAATRATIPSRASLFDPKPVGSNGAGAHITPLFQLVQAASPPEFASPTKDLLTEIKGIGEATERWLNEIGIWTFSQLADQDVAELSQRLDKPFIRQRIQQEGWLEQARIRAQTNGHSARVSEHQTG